MCHLSRKLQVTDDEALQKSITFSLDEDIFDAFYYFTDVVGGSEHRQTMQSLGLQNKAC